MSVRNISNPIDIAVSGLRAERMQMDVIARNIANSRTTGTATDEPFRRQMVIFSTDVESGGVKVDRVGGDMTTKFKQVYNPGHPHADESGHVSMPNIDLPVEMINMVTASRAYQANAAVMKRYQEIVDVALELLR